MAVRATTRRQFVTGIYDITLGEAYNAKDSLQETVGSRRLQEREALCTDLLTATVPGYTKIRNVRESRQASLRQKLDRMSVIAPMPMQEETLKEFVSIADELDEWLRNTRPVKKPNEADASACEHDVVQERHWREFWEHYRSDSRKVDGQSKVSIPSFQKLQSQNCRTPASLRHSVVKSVLPICEEVSNAKHLEMQRCERMLSNPNSLKTSESRQQRSERILGCFLPSDTGEESKVIVSRSAMQSKLSPRGGLTPAETPLPDLPISGNSLLPLTNARARCPAPRKVALGSDVLQTIAPTEPLMPLPPSVQRPWSRSRAKPSRSFETSERREGSEVHAPAVKRFAMICKTVGVHPKPPSMRFLIKGASRGELKLRDAGYADDDMLAISAALNCIDYCLDIVDIGDNSRLTDASICPFLKLLADAHGEWLQELSLDKCRHIGINSVRLCSKLLTSSFSSVRKLNLSGIPIPFQEYAQLVGIINRHPSLNEVLLAETGLGRSDRSNAVECITLLLQSPRLEVLDLSWNFLDSSCLETLGQLMTKNNRMRKLSLANTGPTPDPNLGGSPLLAFLEALRYDSSLTSLDIANNALNWDAAVVLEWAASRHPGLSEVDMSSNPIGLLGMRSLLRLVASPHSELRTLHVVDCQCHSHVVTSGIEGIPSGRRSFNLAFPAHRALFRLLLTRWCNEDISDNDGKADFTHFPADKVLRGTTLDGRSVQVNNLLRRNSQGIWEVPQNGELSTEICIDISVFAEYDSSIEKASQQSSVKPFLERIAKETRVRIPQRRAVPLLALGRRLRTDEERRRFTEALSRDFILDPDHISALCRTTSDGELGFECVNLNSMLLPCLLSSAQVRKALALTRSAGDLVKVHESCMNFLGFNPDNPTGFYALHLDRPCDFHVGNSLLLINRWEVGLWKQKHGDSEVDVSQRGNFKCLRNERYGLRPYAYEADEWALPGHDLLEFDFVSWRRPPADMNTVSHDAWNEFVSRIRKAVDYHSSTSLLSASDVMNCVRATSSIIWIDCLQLRQLLCVLSDDDRMKVFVCFFFRTLDMPLNEKLLRSKFTPKDRLKLKESLGDITVFPFFQPENHRFLLSNLHFYEQRRVLQFLNILVKAEPGNHFANPLYDFKGDGTWGASVYGNPQNWDQFEQLPGSGGFQATYECSQDSVRLCTRRRLAVEWGGWEIKEDVLDVEKEIHLWALLDEQPNEVNEFIEFLAARFDDLATPFHRIDSSKDGKMNLHEFLEGMILIGFTPTKKHRKKEKKEGLVRVKPMTRKATQDRDEETNSQLPTTSKAEDRSGASKDDGSTSTKIPFAKEKTSARNEELYTAIFRFLNVSKSGQMSLKEWKVMAGYFKELRLAMHEFAHFLVHRFGSLDAAWDAADENMSGGIDLEEFLHVGSKWMVDGPLRTIFLYLDKDWTGDISKEEWSIMEALLDIDHRTGKFSQIPKPSQQRRNRADREAQPDKDSDHLAFGMQSTVERSDTSTGVKDTQEVGPERSARGRRARFEDSS